MIIDLEKYPQYGDPSDGGKWMKICKHGNIVQARTWMDASTIKNDEFCRLCQMQKFGNSIIRQIENCHDNLFESFTISKDFPNYDADIAFIKNDMYLVINFDRYHVAVIDYHGNHLLLKVKRKTIDLIKNNIQKGSS